MGAFIKQPDEIENYTIRYDKNFTEGERILTLDVKTEPEDLIVENSIFINAEVPFVRVWLSGGINKQVYKTTVTVTTSNSRTLQDEFKIKIKEF